MLKERSETKEGMQRTGLASGKFVPESEAKGKFGNHKTWLFQNKSIPLVWQFVAPVAQISPRNERFGQTNGHTDIQTIVGSEI